MAVPNRYTDMGEGAIASYDFTEFATGTGYVAFYPFDAANNTAGTASFALTTSTSIYASSAIVSAGVAQNDFLYNAKEFSTKWTRPANIQGKAFVTLQLGSTGGTNPSTNSQVEILKLSDGTKTSIVSGAMFTQAGITGVFKTHTASWILEMPFTHFKINDQLILRVWVQNNAGTATLHMGQDPANRGWDTIMGAAPASGANVTRSALLLPLKVDL